MYIAASKNDWIKPTERIVKSIYIYIYIYILIKLIIIIYNYKIKIIRIK